MKKEKLRWFGIPKLFPYLKGYGRLVLVDMVALGFVGSAMDAVIPLFQQYAIDHFIANETLAGPGRIFGALHSGHDRSDGDKLHLGLRRMQGGNVHRARPQESLL